MPPVLAPHGTASSTALVLALQRSVGNQQVTGAVQRLRLARKPKPKTPPPAKPIDVVSDDVAGKLTSPAGELIGFKTADGKWYATPDGATPVQAGELQPPGSKIPIVKVRGATLAPDGKTITQDKKDALAVLGSAPAVVLAGGKPVALSTLPEALRTLVPATSRLALTGGGLWVAMDLPDGTGVNWVKAKHEKSDYTKRRGAIEAEIKKLPAALQSKVGKNLDVMGMISMLEGGFEGRSGTKTWAAVCTHADHGAKPWQGKEHKKRADADAEGAAHDKEQAAKAAKPDAAAPDAGTPDAGTAGAKPAAPHHAVTRPARGDTAASLGFHQWAMPKKTAAEGSESLVVFFRSLKKKADAAKAKKDDKRTDEDKLYINAWAQCESAGLKFDGKTMKLNGAEPAGFEVEDALAGEMATGDLRTYQVLAVHEELEDKLWGQSVLPGMFGSQMLANKYTAVDPEKDAAFPTERYTIKLSAPAKVATVGEVCTADRLRAAVANVYPNRPAWMGALVWRSLQSSDPGTRAAALIAKIVKAQDDAAAKPAPTPDGGTPDAPKAGPAPDAGTPAAPDAGTKAPPAKTKPDPKKTAKAAPAKPIELTDATAVDKKSLEELRALVWPSGDKADQGQMLAAFYAAALGFYRAEDVNTMPGANWRQHKAKKERKWRKYDSDWTERAGRVAASEHMF